MEEYKSINKKTSSKSYEKLVVYQKSFKLVFLVYQITKDFPKEERFVLMPQMRRCAVSIIANIVEGYSKNSRKDFARFINISIGSATELELYFKLSFELNYFDRMKYEEANQLLLEVKKLLYSFQKGLRER